MNSSSNIRQQGFWALRIFIAFNLIGTLHADIIYFKPDIPLPPLPTGMEYITYRQSPTRTLKGLRGRIITVDSNDLTRFRYQPAKIVKQGKRSIILWATQSGKPDFITCNLANLASVEHDVDGIQDLRWLFSNRDSLLRKMGSPQVYFGYEPFHSYFLAAAQVTPLPAHLKPIPVSLNTELQEGWLVGWLKNGPTTAAERAKKMNDIFLALTAKAKTGREPVKGPGFDPSLQETEIRTTVYSLLEAATQDKSYSGIFYKTPVNKKPTFYLVCRQAVQVLTDLTQETKPYPKELGYQSRDAILMSLENAALGRLTGDERASKPPTSVNPQASLILKIYRYERAASYKKSQGDITAANEAINQALSVCAESLKLKPNNPSALRAIDRLKKLKAELATIKPRPQPEKRPPSIRELFPVDPSEIAIVAMEIICRSKSWQVPYIDTSRQNPGNRTGGDRLISALVKLANKDPSRTKARSKDAAQIAFVQVDDYGKITLLDEAIIATLSHLFAGDQGDFFRNKTAIRLVGATLDEGQLIINTLKNEGFPPAANMNEVIQGLFTLGTASVEVEKNRDEKTRRARRALRMRLRHEAVIHIIHLASLSNSIKPNSVSVADLVTQHASKLLDRIAQGYGTVDEQHLFDDIRSMRLTNHPTHQKYARQFGKSLSEYVNSQMLPNSSNPERNKTLQTLLNKHLRD